MIFRKSFLPLLVFVYLLEGSDIYQSLRVYNPEESTLSVLRDAGIPLDHVRLKKGVYIDVIAEETQTEMIKANGITFDILIPDMTRHFLENNIPEVSRDFELGSMLGNFTYDEVLEKMDSLTAVYPGFVTSKDSIGISVEGRIIYAFKVSDNPNIDEDEPEVLFTGITHAREPLGMMNLFYYVQWLCDNYNSDPIANYLVNERELYFIPVVNPDGYVYNESISPNGGGMHRKNRQQNPPNSGCNEGTQRGVDLNRNFGYEWGADNTGSSPNPCSATFRGDSAFSEPETQIVRNFTLAHNFTNVLHYHSYSNVLIHSWGDGTYPDELDLTTLREIGWEMTKYNGYDVGTGHETIGYGVNGDAVDWSYGVAGLLSYTPEIGSYQENFWPPENRVIPLCADQLYANQIFALVAGADYIVYEHELVEQSDDTLNFSVTIQNRGLLSSDGDVLLNFVPLSEGSIIIDETVTFAEMNEREQEQFFVTLVLPNDLPHGTEVGFLLTMNDNSSFIRTDSIKAIIGSPDIIFADDFENSLTQWETSSWGLSSNAYDGDYSVTDSPQGNYSDNVTTMIKTIDPVNLAALLHPAVRYHASWDIESNYDFVRFQISTDGNQWATLKGLYTEQGVDQGTQSSSEYGYDGVMDWVNEEIDLTDYADQTAVYFRFVLTSDGAVTGDGFYVDDFNVQGFLNFIAGDMDSNGELNIFDLLSIVDLILSTQEFNAYQLQRADANFDGTVDISDIIVLVERIIAE